MSNKLPTTRERLETELSHIENVEMPAAQEAVSEAQRAGDITENTDLAIALGEVARLRRRLEQIRVGLSHDHGEALPAGEVGVGRLVRLRFEGETDDETYLFGTVEDKHPEYSTLTLNSPVGAAVAGRRAGETTRASLGVGELEIEILEVSGD